MDGQRNIVAWAQPTTLTRMPVRHPCPRRGQHLLRVVRAWWINWNHGELYAPRFALRVKPKGRGLVLVRLTKRAAGFSPRGAINAVNHPKSVLLEPLRRIGKPT